MIKLGLVNPEATRRIVGGDLILLDYNSSIVENIPDYLKGLRFLARKVE